MTETALTKLSSIKNLKAVWSDYQPRAKKSSAGINGLTPGQFEDSIDYQLALLRKNLRKGYRYSSLRGIPVPKKDTKKFRIICIPTIQDRLVQRAILRMIEAKADNLGILNEVSFGFVKNTPDKTRGVQAARNAAIKHRQLKPWAFKADISAFFDQIPRDKLIADFQNRFSLKSLSPLVAAAIRCEVDDSDPVVKRVLNANGIIAGRGLRQGMPLSPILSNFLLRDFDRTFIQCGYDLIRYADDLVVLASSRGECEAIEATTIEELRKLNLTISPGKTAICAPNEAVEFLGMDLGLNPRSGKYCLTISSKQIEEIKSEFTVFHDLDFTLSKKLDVLQLSRRLENMKSGYRAAYGVADNFALLDQHLNQWAHNCIIKLYGSIFGSKIIESLTPRQKSFLLLPHRI